MFIKQQSRIKPTKRPQNNFISPPHSDIKRTNQSYQESNNQLTQLNSMIIEYLKSNSYAKSLEAFKLESHKTHKHQSNQTATIMNLFDSGNREQFFNKLNKRISQSIQDKSDTFKKLEFYLQIYFLIFYRKGAYLDKPAIAHFKNYLETKGEEHSISELLPYYALPYIPKPIQHPTIKHIFKKQWSSDLRSQVLKFLNQTSVQPQLTQLEQIFKQYKQNREQSRKSKQNNDKYKDFGETVEILNKRYNELQRKYTEMAEITKNSLIQSQTKWFSLTKQLVKIGQRFAAEIAKHKIHNQEIERLKQRINKYQIFANANVDDLIQNNNGLSIFEQHSLTTLEPNPYVTARNIQNKPILINLDFSRIHKYILGEPNQNSICLLLQALRWRISKTKEPFSRRQIIMSYTTNDLLGLKPQNREVIEMLLRPQSELIQEYTLRLIHAIASDYYGRATLVQNNILLTKLVLIIKRQDYDGVLRRWALNALQNLSVRVKAQVYMIQNGIIKWIIQTIKLEKDDISSLSFQYLTALFMNLTIRRAGRNKCQKERILQLLVDLLNFEELRTYVTGSIFSLLSSLKIRKQAEQIKLRNQLQNYLNDANPEDIFNIQIKYIIQKLDNEHEQDDEEEEQENDDDELMKEQSNQDNILNQDEEQQSEEQIIIGTEDQDHGEDLLMKKFSYFGPEAMKQQYLTRSILEDLVKKNLEISIIKQKKTPRSDINMKPNTAVKSSLEILDVLQNNYDSSKYLPRYGLKKQIEKKNANEIFDSHPLIPRTPPEPN